MNFLQTKCARNHTLHQFLSKAVNTILKFFNVQNLGYVVLLGKILFFRKNYTKQQRLLKEIDIRGDYLCNLVIVNGHPICIGNIEGHIVAQHTVGTVFDFDRFREDFLAFKNTRIARISRDQKAINHCYKIDKDPKNYEYNESDRAR